MCWFLQEQRFEKSTPLKAGTKLADKVFEFL